MDQARVRFEQYLKRRFGQSSTLKHYSSDLNIFIDTVGNKATEAITAEDIDTAVKASLGIRIPILGVVQRYDFAGIDLALQFMKNPPINLVSKDKPSETIKRLVHRGHLGVKSGRGFFDYSGKKMEEIMRDRDIKLLKLKDFLEAI